jgi:hypothetical protein
VRRLGKNSRTAPSGPPLVNSQVLHTAGHPITASHNQPSVNSGGAPKALIAHRLPTTAATPLRIPACPLLIRRSDHARTPGIRGTGASGYGVDDARVFSACQRSFGKGRATQVLLAEEMGLRNCLNINVVYPRKLAQSITSLSLPKILHAWGKRPN